jgi:hypothetical protein
MTVCPLAVVFLKEGRRIFARTGQGRHSNLSGKIGYSF